MECVNDQYKIFTQYIEPFSQLPKTGTTDIFSKYKYSFIKNNGLVFILNKDNAAIGLAFLDKTNLKVCKFVQSLREMGIQIDMEDIRRQVKN